MNFEFIVFVGLVSIIASIAAYAHDDVLLCIIYDIPALLCVLQLFRQTDENLGS